MNRRALIGSGAVAISGALAGNRWSRILAAVGKRLPAGILNCGRDGRVLQPKKHSAVEPRCCSNGLPFVSLDFLQGGGAGNERKGNPFAWLGGLHSVPHAGQDAAVRR